MPDQTDARLEPVDLEGMTPGDKIGFATNGHLAHLRGDPSYQLSRADLKGLTAWQVVAARRAGMLKGIGG